MLKLIMAQAQNAPMQSQGTTFIKLFGSLFVLLVAALVFMFVVWMLVDCVKNETDNTQKIVWALIIFFVPCVGPLVYFFARKMPRKKS